MSAQDRLDFWRSERERLARKLAADPSDARKLNSVFQDDLAHAEACIDFYEQAVKSGGGVSHEPLAHGLWVLIGTTIGLLIVVSVWWR